MLVVLHACMYNKTEEEKTLLQLVLFGHHLTTTQAARKPTAVTEFFFVGRKVLCEESHHGTFITAFPLDAQRQVPHLEAAMMGKIVNVFPGLDDNIQPVQDDGGERFMLYPNGQKVAETILVDYSSLDAGTTKGHLSFSKALSQGNVINRKTKVRKIEAQRRRRKKRFNAKFPNKYLKDARTYGKERPAIQNSSSKLLRLFTKSLMYRLPTSHLL